MGVVFGTEGDQMPAVSRFGYFGEEKKDINA
jgi:hypothetical protein